MKTKEKITKKMSFAEILSKKPEAAEILMQKGMHCCGCPMSQMETLEQGACAHGLNPDEIVYELNKESKKN
jgi:hybrid cluster-associated redox disulfide protein